MPSGMPSNVLAVEDSAAVDEWEREAACRSDRRRHVGELGAGVKVPLGLLVVAAGAARAIASAAKMARARRLEVEKGVMEPL